MAKAFYDVFPGLVLQEDLRELMGQTEVVRVTMNSRRDFLKIYLESDKLIHKKYIFDTEQAIRDQLFSGLKMTVKIIEKFLPKS